VYLLKIRREVKRQGGHVMAGGLKQPQMMLKVPCYSSIKTAGHLSTIYLRTVSKNDFIGSSSLARYVRREEIQNYTISLDSRSHFVHIFE